MLKIQGNKFQNLTLCTIIFLTSQFSRLASLYVLKLMIIDITNKHWNYCSFSLCIINNLSWKRWACSWICNLWQYDGWWTLSLLVQLHFQGLNGDLGQKARKYLAYASPTANFNSPRLDLPNYIFLTHYLKKLEMKRKMNKLENEFLWQSWIWFRLHIAC